MLHEEENEWKRGFDSHLGGTGQAPPRAAPSAPQEMIPWQHIPAQI